MNYAWVEASILLFIAETFVELFGLFDGLLVINVNASLLNLFWFHQLLILNVVSFFIIGKSAEFLLLLSLICFNSWPKKFMVYY